MRIKENLDSSAKPYPVLNKVALLLVVIPVEEYFAKIKTEKAILAVHGNPSIDSIAQRNIKRNTKCNAISSYETR